MSSSITGGIMNLNIQNRTKLTYHTDIQLMAQLDVLPQSLLKDIPKSTLSNFRNRDYSNIYGFEYINLLKESKELLKAYNESEKLRLVCNSILKTRNASIEILNSMNKFDFKKITLKVKEKIVSTIDSVKSELDLDLAIKEFSIFYISKYKYFQWCNELKYQCSDSLFKLCKKLSPQQLISKEVAVIKKALENDFYHGWPVYSIAMHHIKNKLLFVSPSTWYKYVKLLGIKRQKVKSRRKKNKIGIRASRPLEIWHIDVTLFELLDASKAYIYILMDNFSRCILNWDVSLELSGQTTMNLIKSASDKFLKYNFNNESVVLISDGGPENNNKFVDGFLEKKEISIKKLIAQKDISFSNSIVEAMNKILKYQYLYLHDIPNIESLRKHLEHYVPMYNEVRPHCSLDGLTPFEALNYDGLAQDEIVDGFLQAKKNRILINRQHSCGVC